MNKISIKYRSPLVYLLLCYQLAPQYATTSAAFFLSVPAACSVFYIFSKYMQPKLRVGEIRTNVFLCQYITPLHSYTAVIKNVKMFRHGNGNM